MRLLLLLVCLSGCTTVTWIAPDGTSLKASSFLSNKRIAGSLIDDGARRELIVKELEIDETSGAAAITKAAVEGAVKGLKP